jgi:hypothetical protein
MDGTHHKVIALDNAAVSQPAFSKAHSKQRITIMRMTWLSFVSDLGGKRRPESLDPMFTE